MGRELRPVRCSGGKHQVVFLDRIQEPRATVCCAPWIVSQVIERADAGTTELPEFLSGQRHSRGGNDVARPPALTLGHHKLAKVAEPRRTPAAKPPIGSTQPRRP